MERRFKRDLKSLEEIFRFADEFVRECRVDPKYKYLVDLSLEELFSNQVKYNIEGSAEVLIRLEREDDALVISLTDYGGAPFDPTQAPAPNVDASLDERPIGGLGIYLVRKLADQFHYEYSGHESKITVRKSLR